MSSLNQAAVFLCLILLLAVVAFTQNTIHFNTEGEVYEGFVSFGFEVSSFHSCSIEEGWWVDQSVDELYEAYSAQRLAEYTPMYARVRASISERGRYGHMGGSERSVEIHEVYETVEAEKAPCVPEAYWWQYSGSLD